MRGYQHSYIILAKRAMDIESCCRLVSDKNHEKLLSKIAAGREPEYCGANKEDKAKVHFT